MSHPLTYDTLPPHSQLRREFSDGIMKIVAGPEEPGPLVRRGLLVRSALPAAVICFATLAIGLAVFGATYLAHRASMPGWMSIALAIAYVIFCVALFTLTWRVQYASRLQAAQNALRQTTILAASRGRLLIETSGPMGTASHDLRNVRAFKKRRGDVDSLEIATDDGTAIQILWGRDEVELEWVGRALGSALSS